jgi:hypothetical protein
MALHPDAYCPRCHENVTPVRDLATGAIVCPWCDGQTEDLFAHEKRWCKACDLMVDPANDGTCWRCGTKTQRGTPWDACACGCGTQIHRFDEHGRRIRYVQGHAPRALERDSLVPTEPFASYLEERLRSLDLVAAVAREHGISRELVVAVLRRDEPTVPRSKVRHALWVYGQNGRGMPRKPDSRSFFDLYPDDKRARTCPGCGRGKAPHAELCKQCRKKRGRGNNGGRAQIRIGERVLADAYRAYREENLPYLAVAQRFIDRVPHTSVEGLAATFAKAFKQKGWPVRQRTTTRRKPHE